MRKRSLLSLANLSVALAIFAQPNALSNSIQRASNQIDLRERVDLAQYAPQNQKAQAQAKHELPKKPTLKQIYRETEAQTTTYMAVQQSMYSGYSFAYMNGDIWMWNVDVTIDGSVATISNLFDLDNPNDPYNTNVEYDIVGTYDEAAGTITVPTPSTFENATIVGSFYNYYPAVLFAGKVAPDGSMEETDSELVFTINKEKNTITTDRHYGCAMFTSDGSQSYGVQECFASTLLTHQTQGADLLVFAESIDFGELYVNYPISSTFKVANIGDTAGDYVIDIEGEGFTVTPNVGSIEPLAIETFTVTFNAPEANMEYEGIITIATDNGDTLVQLQGSSIPYPDYSSIVLSGDISFSTGMEYPFAIDNSLVEGKSVAKMTIPVGVRTYTPSYLTAIVEVPENHIGTLSWKGVATSVNGYNALGGIYIDEAANPAYLFQNVTNYDISNSQNFGPGKHTVRFVYEAPYACVENDILYVYDLNFTSVEAVDSKVSVASDKVEFGNFIIEDNPISGTQTIQLLNEGKQPLKVLSATSTENFTITIPTGEAGLLEYLPVTATFTANQAGTFEGDIVITTTAGDITVHNHAFVREMPDFSQIVEEGEFTFETDPAFPYIVENGIAYNSTSKVIDNTPTTSYLKCSFVIPEGKLGILSWDAEVSYKSPYKEDYTNVGGESYYVKIQQPLSSYWWCEYYYGTDTPAEFDMSSEALIAKSDDWTDYSQYTLFTPGDQSYIQFDYYQGGDGEYLGEDWLAVKKLKLVLIDFEEYAAKIDVDNLEFETIYEGSRSKTQKVTFTNIGSQNLEILSVSCDGPFTADISNVYPTAFQGKVSIPVYFNPAEEGTYESDLVIETSAGQFIVKCKGIAESTEEFIFIEDFEKDAKGWYVVDADSDGLTWDLGSNLLGGQEELYVRSGRQALVSMSYNYNLGGLTPDNWALSPEFTIPATSTENVLLTWWVGLQVADQYIGDNYTVYITEKPLGDKLIEEDWEEIYNEIPQNIEWTKNEVDISKFAGKTCRLAFRHHDCENKWMLKIDDVIIIDNASGSVKDLDSNKVIISQEYYSIDGLKVEKPENGIYIVKSKYEDGSVTSKKTIIKK